MRYTTCIFDLDGTLLDTLDDLTDAVNFTLRRFGYKERSRDEVRLFVGNGARRLLERSLGGTPENFDEILAFYDEYYTAHSAEKTAPYPGVMDLLRELCRRERKVAVVSNKQDAAVKKLVRRYFPGLISVAVGQKKGVGPKPAPDSVRAAMAELWSESWECVYIGDSDVDIMTARAAGTAVISVDWGFRSRDFLMQHGAGTVISSPGELLKLV